MGKMTSISNLAVRMNLVKGPVASRRAQPVGIRGSRRNIRATVEMIDEDGTSLAFDKVQLSPFGAYLYTEYLHLEGESLNLRVCLPGCVEPMMLEAEVVHANVADQSGMGVAFTEVSWEDRRMLQDYVSGRVRRTLSPLAP